MKRFLALVASVAMVAGAWTLRSSWERDGSPGFGAGPPLQLICATDLRQACEVLDDEDVEVTVEDAGQTADRLAGLPAADADGWLTLQPWPQIVADRRDRAGLEPLAEGTPLVVGRSPLVMAVWQERAAVLDEQCGDEMTWRCVGRHADRGWDALGGEPGWGKLKVGYPDPRTTASGLLVLGQAARDFFEGADFATRDLDSDEFRDWLGGLANGVPSQAAGARRPVEQMVRLGEGFLDVAGTTEAEAAPLLRSPRAGSLTLRFPETVVVAEAALAPLREDRSDRLRDVVEEVGAPALAQAGWRVEGQPLAEGLSDGVELPRETGLPSAGALEALLVRYGEIR